MTTPGTDLNGLGAFLQDLLDRQPHTSRALLLSADGLTAATSHDVDRDMADRVSAAVSGMQSLSKTAAEFADCPLDEPELIIVQYRGGYLFVVAAGSGTYLAVSAESAADGGALSYAMEKTVDRIGREMNLATRDTGGPA